MTDMFGPDEPEGPPDYWEDRWAETGEPEWWDADVTIYNDFFEPITYTAEDWYNEVTVYNAEELMEMYGLDNLDIIHQLEDQGLWDSDDWAYWRELYG